MKASKSIACRCCVNIAGQSATGIANQSTRRVAYGMFATPPMLYLPRYKGGDPLGKSQNLSRYTIRRSQASFGDPRARGCVEDERFAAPAECPSRRVSEGLTARVVTGDAPRASLTGLELPPPRRRTRQPPCAWRWPSAAPPWPRPRPLRSQLAPRQPAPDAGRPWPPAAGPASEASDGDGRRPSRSGYKSARTLAFCGASIVSRSAAATIRRTYSLHCSVSASSYCLGSPHSVRRTTN